MIEVHSTEHIGVIGGGFAGLTAALRLAQAGHQVTLWEKGRLGGQAATFEVAGTRLEIFYHHLFQSDTRDRRPCAGNRRRRQADVAAVQCWLLRGWPDLSAQRRPGSAAAWAASHSSTGSGSGSSLPTCNGSGLEEVRNRHRARVADARARQAGLRPDTRGATAGQVRIVITTRCRWSGSGARSGCARRPADPRSTRKSSATSTAASRSWSMRWSRPARTLA